MRREFSAGGIIFKKQGDKVFYLLVEIMSMKDSNKKYWGFPKGHIDPGESSKETAIREVKEETGVETEIIEKIEDSKYMFTGSDGEKIFKVVSFYLMEAKGGELNRQVDEISDIGWFEKDQAFEKISFPNDKKLFNKALELIASHPEFSSGSRKDAETSSA